MLIKNGFEGIDFFANHPEMLPHVGNERNLFVGECVHLPEKIFENQAEKFFGDKIPENIHFFNSEFPSQWSEESYKEFVTVVENFATKRAKYHLQNWTRVTGRKNFVEVKNVD